MLAYNLTNQSEVEWVKPKLMDLLGLTKPKTCTKCFEDLPIYVFYSESRGNIGKHCYSCRTETNLYSKIRRDQR